jgi:hypothetical protein
MAPRYTYGDERELLLKHRAHRAAVPRRGAPPQHRTVIDCTPGKDRMPPVTIDFLNKNLPQQSEAEAEAPAPAPAPASAVAAQEVTGSFTCNSGDFVLFSQ